MKSRVLLSVVSISLIVLAGCAGTASKKSSGDAAPQVAKALTAKDVFARYAKTIYGKDGVRKHTATTLKGTASIEQFSIDGPFVLYSTAPNSNVSTVELMGMKLSTGCHKGVCWAQQPGSSTALLSGDALAFQLQQSDYNQWEHLDRYYTSMEIVEPADGAANPNTKIKAVKKNGDTDYYDFAKDSGLLVAALLEGETAQGKMKIGIQFRNYKEFEGQLVATELVQTVPQATIKIVFDQVSFAPIGEDKFAKPD
jgi:hypothetical protein